MNHDSNNEIFFLSFEKHALIVPRVSPRREQLVRAERLKDMGIIDIALPENVTPEDSKLEDPMERERLARVFRRGLSAPAGFILPIQRWNAASADRRWISQRGTTRAGPLLLTPVLRSCVMAP